MRRQGFTLYEILVSVAVLASVMVLALANGRTAASSSQPHAVAEILAGEFRQAHQRALAEHRPVAVVVPSQGNSRPHSNSVYIMAGEEKPRPSRVVDFSREFPLAVVGVAHWSLGSGVTTLDPPVKEPMDVNAWAGSGFKDYAFVYDASGRLHTNMLPNFGGAYHLVVSTGLDYSQSNPASSTSPPLSHFALSRVSQAYTLRLTPSGGVQLSKGLLEASSSVAQLTNNLGGTAPAARVPVNTSPNQDPVIASLDFAPKLPAGGAGGSTAFVDKNGFLSLKVKAQDPEGGPLYINWTADGGTFSYKGRVRMQWNQQAQAWTSTWEWRPPFPFVAGQKYALTCQVADPLGAVVSLADPALQAVEPISGGRIGYNDVAGGAKMVLQNGTPLGGFGTGDYQWLQISSDGKKALWRQWINPSSGTAICNTDGTSPQFLPTGNPQNQSWSPDGSKILFWNLGGWPMTVCVMNADGTSVTSLTPASNSYSIAEEPRWASRGDRILVYRNGAAHLVNPDGTKLEPLQGVPIPLRKSTPSGAYGFDFSPDNTKMCYYTSTGLWVCDLADDPSDTTYPVLSNPVKISSDRLFYGPRWSPRGDVIAYYAYSGGSQTLKLINPDGTGPASLGCQVKMNYSTPSWCR